MGEKTVWTTPVQGMLFRELEKDEDPEAFRGFLRMDIETFGDLIELIEKPNNIECIRFLPENVLQSPWKQVGIARTSCHFRL